MDSETQTWFLEANDLYAEDRFADAEILYRKILERFPEMPEVWSNLGNSLAAQRQFTSALRAFGKALQIKPDFSSALWNRSLVYLTLGNYSLGWAEYECRWAEGLKSYRSFPEPLWDGRNLHNEKILIFGEQGLGDSIQFVRFASAVARRGGRVFLACRTPLVRLFERVSGIEKVFDTKDQYSSVDWVCPMMSLPRILDVKLENLPWETDYLHFSPFRKSITHVSPSARPLKIGISWRVNTADLRRSCPLQSLLDCLPKNSECSIFQRDLTDSEKLSLSKFAQNNRIIIDAVSTSSDLLDTAMSLQNMDFVISVDNVIAHLAGAIGKPVYVLLTRDANWRWLEDRCDSPWYPTAHLIRQQSQGAWNSVWTTLRERLTENHAY